MRWISKGPAPGIDTPEYGVRGQDERARAEVDVTAAQPA